MPNTTPALDDDTQIGFVYTRAREAGLCHVLPIGAITKGRKGEELAEMGLMKEAGAVGFSDDGIGVGSAAVMLKALQYVKMIGSVLTQHCEEPTLSGGPMSAGPTAVKLGLGGLAGGGGGIDDRSGSVVEPANRGAVSRAAYFDGGGGGTGAAGEETGATRDGGSCAASSAADG